MPSQGGMAGRLRYSIKNAFVISPLITARGAGTTPRSEKSMAEKLLLVMFW